MAVVVPPDAPTGVNVTTDVTPGVLTRLTMPDTVAGLQISIWPRQPGAAVGFFFTYVGVDGQPVGQAVQFPLPSNQWTALDQLTGDIYVGAAVALVGAVVAVGTRP